MLGWKMLMNSPFFYQLIKINLHKEPKRLFYKSEISSISDGQARALQMRQSKSFFPVRIGHKWGNETLKAFINWRAHFNIMICGKTEIGLNKCVWISILYFSFPEELDFSVPESPCHNWVCSFYYHSRVHKWNH